MANLYDKAGLVNIPVGYQDGFLYNIKPEDNTLGFRFNRNSSATRVNKEGLIEQIGYFGPELVQNGDFSQLGPELVTNGDFATDSSWVKGAGWTISNGSANASNSTSDLYQENIVQSGKYYKVTYTISNYVSGSVRVELPNNSYAGIERSANGTYTETLLSNGTTFLFDARTSFTGSIDNVSVKQVDPNDYWNLGNGWSIGDGKAVCDTSSAYTNFQQPIGTSINKTYKLTYEVLDYSSGSVQFIIGNSGSRPQGQLRSANGTYSETFTIDSSTVDADKLFIRGGASGFIGSITNISVIEVLGDKPRIDYTDSLTSPSFLLEPQSTNLLPYSEDFSKWEKNSGTTITPNNSISPDGSNNSTLVVSAGSGARVGYNVNITSGNTYTLSVYLKNNGGSNSIKIGSYTTNQFETVTINNQWARYTTTFTASSTVSSSIRIVSSGNNINFYAWGAQLEQLPYASSYIPTAGSTVTRAQETCVDAGNVSTFNSTEGVLYAEMAALADDGTFRYITINDGTDQNVVAIRFSETSNQILAFTRISGSFNAVLSTTSYSTLNFNKIAYRYKSGDFGLFINGTKISSSTSTQTLPANTLNTLSFDNAPFSPMHGKVKSVYVFNEALTDDELQQLTT